MRPRSTLTLLIATLVYQVAAEYSGCSTPLGLSMTRLSSFKMGPWQGSGSLEIVDYDSFSKLAALVEAGGSPDAPRALAVVNYADPSAPVLHKRILLSTAAGEGNTVGAPNSVATWNGFAAVALDGSPATSSGVLRIYHLASGAKVGEAVLPNCAMPDSIVWTHDGSRIMAACEGEPVTQNIAGSDPTVDPNPVGGFAIVYVSVKSYTPVNATCPTADFTLTVKVLDYQAYIDSLSPTKYRSLLQKGLRIDPRLTQANAGRDIEPEFIALHSDPNVNLAYVTLQENNAVSVIDTTPGRERIKCIWPLGLKNWSTTPLDASDVDGTVLRTHPGLYSWYQPDGIAHAVISKRPYLFIANEGDAKEQTRRVKDLASLDPEVFGDVAAVKQNTDLGRLLVDPFFGLKYGYNASRDWTAQGPYNKLIAYGGRSFAILDAVTGKMIYESGSDLELLMASDPAARACFNCDRDSNSADSRSDNGGPEPEGIVTFQMQGRMWRLVWSGWAAWCCTTSPARRLRCSGPTSTAATSARLRRRPPRSWATWHPRGSSSWQPRAAPTARPSCWRRMRSAPRPRFGPSSRVEREGRGSGLTQRRTRADGWSYIQRALRPRPAPVIHYSHAAACIVAEHCMPLLGGLAS